MKYDQEFEVVIYDKKVDVGIIDGDNTIVIIVPGQNSNIYGYNKRYLKLSNKINYKYGSTIIIFSNPFNFENPMKDLMHIIKKYAKRFNNYTLCFFGFSKGAIIGAQYATKEKEFERMVLINGPLMINYHKTKEGINEFKGEMINFIYGSLDPSSKYVGLLSLIKKGNIKVTILENVGHNVENEEMFLSLADIGLFYDK